MSQVALPAFANHDHSCPSGATVNDYIDHVRMSYAGVDQAFAAMRPGLNLATEYR